MAFDFFEFQASVCELGENNYTNYSDGCVCVFYKEINKDYEPDLEWFGNINNITDSELLMIVIVLKKYLDIFEERKYINCNFIEYILDIYRLLFGENIYWELKGSFIHNDYKKFIDDCRLLILIILMGIIKCNTLPK